MKIDKIQFIWFWGKPIFHWWAYPPDFSNPIYHGKPIIWRSAIYKRDNYTCQQCKVRGSRLEAHHVKPFATHPELRFDAGNGITLCKLCRRGGDAKCRQANDLR